MISRRGLLAGILAGCSAPAVAKASSLMRLAAPRLILPAGACWDTGRDYVAGGFDIAGSDVVYSGEWVVETSQGRMGLWTPCEPAARGIRLPNPDPRQGWRINTWRDA